MTVRYRRALAILAFWAAWLGVTVATLGNTIAWPWWGLLAVLVAAGGLLVAGLVHLVRPFRALTITTEGVRTPFGKLPWAGVASGEVVGSERWPTVRLHARRRLRSVALSEILVVGPLVEGVTQGAAAAGVPVEDRRPTPGAVRVWHLAGFALSGIGMVAITGLMVVPGLWVEGAGSVIEAHGRLGGAGERPAHGDVLILTTREGPASIEDLLSRDRSDRFGWRNPFGARGASARRSPADDAAEDGAVAAGLRCAGKPVTVDGGGVRVGRVATGLNLREGDRIVAVAGAPVTYAEDVFAAVAGMEPDGHVEFAVKGPDGATRVTQVPLFRSPEGPVVPAGVELLHGPIKVTTAEPAPSFDLADTTGDSAGLAIAITAVDTSRPAGVVPAGARVAMTGSVSPDGLVGPVGGIRFKAAAARSAGATVLLVPATQEPVARAAAGGLRVVGVHTVSEAVQALGGPPC